MNNHENRLTRHLLAEELFGSLEKYEFEGLKQGIAENAQGVRVWLYQGHVLCGWHTYLACQQLGIEPEYVEVEAKNDDEALLKALSLELRRRSYTEQQRCAIWFRAADKIPPLQEAVERIVREAGKRQRAGLKRGGEAPSRQPQLEANGKAAGKVGELLGVFGPSWSGTDACSTCRRNGTRRPRQVSPSTVPSTWHPGSTASKRPKSCPR